MIEAEACPEHIHMLVSISPHISVATYMGYVKSKSSLMIFDKHANLKYKYGNRHFWCRGYYVDTVGKYENAIKDYIRNQLQKKRVRHKKQPPRRGLSGNNGVIARLFDAP